MNNFVIMIAMGNVALFFMAIVNIVLSSKEKREEKLYKISDIVKFPYGTRFENIETGSVYVMEQELKIVKGNGEYDYPAIGRDTFDEDYRIVE